MAKKLEEQSELDIKRHARRRLVGAVAFTLLVVAILPMILESEPKPTVQNQVSLDIPDKKTAPEFVATPPKPVTSNPASIPDAELSIEDQVNAAINNSYEESNPPANKPAPIVKEVLAPHHEPEHIKTIEQTIQEAVATKPKVVEHPVKKPEPKVVAEPSNPAKVETVVKIAEEPAKPTKPVKIESASQITDVPKHDETAKKGSGFVAQIGAYSQQDTANSEVDKLRKMGFKAYTEKSGAMVRVRVGPYQDRALAEDAIRKLQEQGVPSVIMGVK